MAMWRKSAAAAREMLKQAAADERGVPVDLVETEPGVVVHRPTGRRLAYGQLVDRARALPVPQSPKLKTPGQFRYIGKITGLAPEKVTAWWHRIVGPGILAQKRRLAGGATVDPAAVSGARDLPYDIPDLRVEWLDKDFGVPVRFWRSVGSSQNAFIIESFIDELAHLAGKDPFAYRRSLLGRSPRHKAVLELAAARANWGAPLPAGRARGVAVASSYGSYAAHVIEASVAADDAVRVHRVVCAIDCGIAVNPDQVRAQMEGGAVYALTAALSSRTSTTTR